MKSILRNILILSALIVSVAIVGPPRGHASQTIVNSFGSVPGTPTYVCQHNFCMGFAGEVYKDNDETNPNADYYGAKMFVIAHDGTGPSHFVTQINDAFIKFPNQATDLGQFDPQTGTKSSQSSVSISYSFVSINLLLPTQIIDASSSGGGGSTNPLSYNWTITDTAFDETACCWQGVLGSHADFGAIVQVPEGFNGFTVTFNAHVFLAHGCTMQIDGTVICNGDWYNFNVSLFIDTANFLSISPSQIQEYCSGGSSPTCFTEPYGGLRPTNVDLLIADSVSETWSALSIRCPSGWSCSLQSSSISVTAGTPGSDQLMVSVPYGQVAGYYTISLTGTSPSHGPQTLGLNVPLFYQAASGGGPHPSSLTG